MATPGQEARESPFFRTLLVVCTIASIAPLFAARYLPMTDMPEHVATMATIRHWFDPAWGANTYFELTGFGKTQYWLYHIAGALLTAVTGSAERANLVLLAAVGIAYPYSLRALLRALGRDPRLALFGCALFWTQSLTIGLLNFVASVPVVLFGLALVVRQAEAPTRRRFFGLCGVAVAILYLHISSFMLFVGDAAILVWLLPSPTTALSRAQILARAWRAPRRLVWLTPSAVCVALLLAAGHAGAGKMHGDRFTWVPRLELVKRVPDWLFDCWHSRVDDVLGWLLVGALAVLLVLSPRGKTIRERWDFRVVAMLFGVSVVVLLAMPSWAGAYAGLLDIRMSVFVAFFAVLLPKPRLRLAGSLPLGFAAAAALLLSVNCAYEIHAFERDEVGHFDDLLQKMPQGRRLLSLNFDPRSSHANSAPFNYFGSYYRARYGGVASFSFNEIPHWPVHYRDEARPPGGLTWGNPCLFDNATQGEYYDFVLVHGERDPIAKEPAGPAWELIGSSRAFHLYRRVPGETRPGDNQSLCS